MRGNDHFATTRWTLVMKAGGSDDRQAETALEELCRAYWFPLYAYVRRRGYGREDAEDLTQGFFSRLLERRDFASAGDGKGRFRAFLLAAMKHHLANEYDRATRLKRGGGVPHLSLDWEGAESRFELADEGHAGPEEAFDREWALALLERVLERLRAEWKEAGREGIFEAMKTFLTSGKGETRYREIAQRLGMEEGSARVMAHRLRKRYRILLRDEIGQTLEEPGMVEEELGVLMKAF